ncbi:hypothetical protein NHH03_22330 [Stieleria sp. TO1_6]|uniref:hypothetical protein n=1 Tax=Stieleria tagensis TaxID=2956795 RepID=UPI00209A9F51|nr:hypothetical protein [Stieleria tagensis]MCO8124493.1 hypothetical protein [Stieleria tagensis]
MSEYCPVRNGVKPIAGDLEHFANLDGIEIIELCRSERYDGLCSRLTCSATTHSFIRYDINGGSAFDQSRNLFDLLIEWLMFNHRAEVARQLRTDFSELRQAVFLWEDEARTKLATLETDKINAPNIRGNLEWLLGQPMHRWYAEIHQLATELLKFLRHLETSLTAATSETIDTYTAKALLGTKSNASLQRWAKAAGVQSVSRGCWKRDDIERIRAIRETSND